MDQDKAFYGRLEFTRRLTAEELGVVERIIHAGDCSDDPGIQAAVEMQAIRRADRRGSPEPVFDAEENADLRARLRGFMARKGFISA